MILPVLAFARNSYYNHLPKHVKKFDIFSVHAPQNAYDFIKPANVDKPLISLAKQKQLVKKFFSRFFSPWFKSYYSRQLPLDYAKEHLKPFENSLILSFRKHLGIGENFRHHSKQWFDNMSKNMDIVSFPNMNAAAITVENAYLRLLPTIIPRYGSFHAAGQGYPFDSFQESTVLAGTPLHVLQLSNDGAWAFVITPAITGWIRTNNIAYVSLDFIKQWEKAPYVATIVNHAAIKDLSGEFRFRAYMGSIFPVVKAGKNTYQILVPVRDINGNAVIETANVSKQFMTNMPFYMTSNHFAQLINEQLGTPYGWGGLYFYTDCSSSLKDLFVPFGIWLPRNSKAQASTAPQMSLAKLSPVERQAAIIKYATPFTTLISVTGHIMLYVGKYHGSIMTFQNVWALASLSSTGEQGRSIIGKAVLMPLKLHYGNKGLFSQIDGDKLALTFLGR